MSVLDWSSRAASTRLAATKRTRVLRWFLMTLAPKT